MGPDKDPAFRAKRNAVIRFVREIWLSSADPSWSRAHTDVLTPRELIKLVQMINDHQRSSQPNESLIVNWIINSFKDFGIKITNPVQWAIQHDTFAATISTKHNIKNMLVKAWDRCLKDDIANHDENVNQTLDLATIRGLAGKMSTSNRTIYNQALAGTVYTYQRANNIGANVEATCPLWCCALDTILHRLVDCKKSPTDWRSRKGSLSRIYSGPQSRKEPSSE